MLIEDEGSRIFGSSNWTRGNQDRERIDERSIRLADYVILETAYSMIEL